MAWAEIRHVKSKSKFKHIQKITLNGKDYWTVNIKGVRHELFESERDAAIEADKCLIKKGKDSVNVLKRKKA